MIAALTQDRNRFGAEIFDELPSDWSAAEASPYEMLATLAQISLKREAGAGGIPRLNKAQSDMLAAVVVRTRLTTPCARAFALAGCAMPPPLAATIESSRVRAAISNGRVLALARLAFPILARASIPVIAFKGPFQHRQIHGDPFFCRSGDLDLLVSRADFIPALAAFESEGFVRREGTNPWWTTALGEVHLVHPQGGVIDLHHRLQQPGCPPPHDLGAFLRTPEHAIISGVEAALPTRPQSVLICALNFTKEFAHRRLSARYAYDFAAGLLAMDADEHRAFAELVTHQQLTGTVALAAALAEEIFTLALPMAWPLHRRPLPDWAERSALLAMVFDPESTTTAWPRRRAILWSMCSDSPGKGKAAEFTREAARMIGSEALRRAVAPGG